MPTTQGTGRFATLPWEMVEAIAVNLRTADVLNLARASRFFLPLLTSQSFWASRFDSGHERDFIFETRNSKEARNWITLYQMTSRACSPPGLKNRRRIWKLIKALNGSLCTRLDETLESCRMNLKPDGLRWNEVAGDIHDRTVFERGHRAPFNVGCRLFLKQCTSMPSNLAKIAFSVITLSEGVERVTGMRLISDDNAEICLGYVARSQEAFLETTTMQGLILAVGSQGVHALQVIGSDGYVSRWFGCPEHASLTGVCVTKLGNLCCIEFQYDTENVPPEIRKLGRRKATEFSRTECFQIDGPGGELLQSVSVRLKRVAGEDVYRFHKHGSLMSFKVSGAAPNPPLISQGYIAGGGSRLLTRFVNRLQPIAEDRQNFCQMTFLLMSVH